MILLKFCAEKFLNKINVRYENYVKIIPKEHEELKVFINFSGQKTLFPIEMFMLPKIITSITNYSFYDIVLACSGYFIIEGILEFMHDK